jgi:cytoskeletal protein RodZ
MLLRRSGWSLGLGLIGLAWADASIAQQAPGAANAAQAPSTGVATESKAPKRASAAKKERNTETSTSAAMAGAASMLPHRSEPASGVAKSGGAAADMRASTRPAPGANVSPAQTAQPVALAGVRPTPSLPASVAVPTATPAPVPRQAANQPSCTLVDAEQPRGGRLEVLGARFGASPVVRIAGKPARMIERKADRLSVQVPADSNGGLITLLNEGKSSSCGTLVIIGKNR